MAAHHLCSQAPGPGSQRCSHPVPRSQFARDARCGRLAHGAGVPLPKSLSASHETTQLQQGARAGSTRAPFPRVGAPGRDGAGSSPPPAELRARSRPGTYFFHLVAPKLWGPQSNRKGDQCWRRREAPGVNTERRGRAAGRLRGRARPSPSSSGRAAAPRPRSCTFELSFTAGRKAAQLTNKVLGAAGSLKQSSSPTGSKSSG